MVAKRLIAVLLCAATLQGLARSTAEPGSLQGSHLYHGQRDAKLLSGQGLRQLHGPVADSTFTGAAERSHAPGRRPLATTATTIMQPLFSSTSNCTGTAGSKCIGWQNPVLRAPDGSVQDFADPGCSYFPAAGEAPYWCYSTNSRGRNVPAAYSSNLSVWTLQTSDALPVLPSWAGRGVTWAPEAIYLKGQYVMYFAARLNSTVNITHCIGVANSSTPGGPFVSASSTPLLCRPEWNGDIDPSPFLDTNGSVWLLTKNDGLTGFPQRPVSIWLMQLTADGMSLAPGALPVPILAPQYGFQGSVIEAPQLVRCGAGYCLFYSANCFRTTMYSVGLAVSSSSILGPYVAAKTPLLVSNVAAGSVLGPGGQSVFTDASGTAWMMYHSWYDQNLRQRPLSMTELLSGLGTSNIVVAGLQNGVALYLNGTPVASSPVVSPPYYGASPCAAPAPVPAVPVSAAGR